MPKKKKNLNQRNGQNDAGHPRTKLHVEQRPKPIINLSSAYIQGGYIRTDLIPLVMNICQGWQKQHNFVSIAVNISKEKEFMYLS